MDQSYQPLQEKAYIHLKNLILSDALESGVIYSETKMAKELELSRTPFKAALVRLSQDKYIDIIPSKGFQVHVLSELDIESTYQTRTAIELFCTLLLMEQQQMPAAEETLAAMDQSLEEMQKLAAADAAESAQAGAFEAQDRAFHSALLAYAKNEEFNRLYEFSIYHQVVTAAKGHTLSQEEKVITREEHRKILEAIRSGSSSACCRAVQQHMQTNRENGLENLRRQRQSF